MSRNLFYRTAHLQPLPDMKRKRPSNWMISLAYVCAALGVAALVVAGVQSLSDVALLSSPWTTGFGLVAGGFLLYVFGQRSARSHTEGAG